MTVSTQNSNIFDSAELFLCFDRLPRLPNEKQGTLEVMQTSRTLSSTVFSTLSRSSAGLTRASRGSLNVLFIGSILLLVDETSRIEIRRLEGIQPLIALLASPSESVQENAAHALFQCALNGI